MVGNWPQSGAQSHPLKIFHCPNIGMWGVYPEAMAWNIGAVYSEINLGECIWKSSPKVHSKCTFYNWLWIALMGYTCQYNKQWQFLWVSNTKTWQCDIENKTTNIVFNENILPTKHVNFSAKFNILVLMENLTLKTINKYCV